jgi:hypothetical protein
VSGLRWAEFAGRIGEVRVYVSNNPDLANVANRKLVGLAWIAQRWSCSRQTCRRVLQRHGVRPLFLGGDARNATVRFDRADVERVEAEAQGRAVRGEV